MSKRFYATVTKLCKRCDSPFQTDFVPYKNCPLCRKKYAKNNLSFYHLFTTKQLQELGDSIREMAKEQQSDVLI